MPLSAHIFIYNSLLYFQTLQFITPSSFIFSTHHWDLSELDSCAEIGDFEILRQNIESFYTGVHFTGYHSNS